MDDNFSIIQEHVDFVNEAYFGKSETLLELENAIGALRENYSFKRDYTATPEIKRIENAFKKQFNMEYFSLNIVPQNIPNAFTYTVGTRFDVVKEDSLSRYVIADHKKGYRFRDGNGFIIVAVIYGGVLANPNITDAEIVAILLHELGHNFADVISNDVKVSNQELCEMYWLIAMLRAILIRKPTLKDDIKFGLTNRNEYWVKKKEQEKVKGRVYAFNQYTKGKVKDFFFNSKLFAKHLFKGVRASVLGPRLLMLNKKQSSGYNAVKNTSIKVNPGRQNEIIADKFAAIYGYGPDIMSGLIKLDKTVMPGDKVLRSLPFGEVLYKNNMINSMDYFKDDVHPDNIQRCNTIMESLEFELSKPNLDPEIRKVVEKQLKEMKNLKKEYMMITDNDNDVDVILKAYSAVVEDRMPDATTKELEKEINNQIDILCDTSY